MNSPQNSQDIPPIVQEIAAHLMAVPISWHLPTEEDREAPVVIVFEDGRKMSFYEKDIQIMRHEPTVGATPPARPATPKPSERSTRPATPRRSRPPRRDK